MCPPGGGGVGDAFERDVDAVRRDVINGFVSIDGAALDYGVVIDPDNHAINETETAKLRTR